MTARRTPCHVSADARIFVAGRSTLIGAALVELLASRGFANVLTEEPDLTDAGAVESFFRTHQPEFVFLVGGKSGGIGLNRARPAELMLDNLRIITNVLDAAHRHGVRKLLYTASSCAYPRHAPQPLRPESLGTGPLEPTSVAYATAKFAGWKLCEAYHQQHGCDFVTAFPANPFGPHDDFTPEGGHVIPALIRRAHEAKLNGDAVLDVWGTGTPRREFIFARDLADACLFALQNLSGDEPINLGIGTDLSIREVAQTVAEVVGFRGRLHFDDSKPDGAPLKALDSTVLRSLGWQPTVGFRAGVTETYRWFQRNETIGTPSTEAQGMHARLYQALYRIRRVEEEVARAYPSDKIKSPVHLSIGQEAVSVGICEALTPRDIVFGTYRGHAMYLAKGGSMAEMVAEMFGKATGCTKGKGGSMHLIAPECGVMGTSAVVGTTIANAAGYAYSLKIRRSDAVVVNFFGDGATEEGVFAETLNFAVLKQLPVLFVCENNGYAIHTSQTKRQGKPDIRGRAEAFGMPAERLDGNDVIGLFQRTREVLAEIRAGGGPRFFEVATYRWREHVGPGRDFQLGYRAESECEPWIAADPVQKLGELLTATDRARIQAEAEAEVTAAFAFAEASPFPDAAELMTDIFQEDADAVVACQR